MREYVEILGRAPELPAGMTRSMHRLRAGEPRQFGTMTLTLETSYDATTNKVQIQLVIVIGGQKYQSSVRTLPVPGIDEAMLYPRAVHWSMDHEFSPDVVMELHLPASVQQAMP